MIVFCEACGGKNSVSAEPDGAAGVSQRCRICDEPVRKDAAAEAVPVSSQPPPEEKLRVMIVDDSALIRQAVRRIVETSRHLSVAGEAKHGAEALDLLPPTDPDVIPLDINMPVMDGLTALKHIMIQKPTPTGVFSTLTQEGSREAFRALEYGAADVMHKPSRVAEIDLHQQQRIIVQKIGLAADVKTEAIRYIRNRDLPPKKNATGSLAPEYAVTIGAAEGGHSGLLRIIPRLRPDVRAAFLVLLYAPANHVEDFARYMDLISAVRVHRASNGAPLISGVCHIAAENEYMTIEQSGETPLLRVQPAPFSERRGAVNMLMFSAAEIFGDRSAGVVLSGKGRDGREGLQEILRVSGSGIVQNPNSCLYKEMAQSIIENCTDRRS